MSDKIMQYIMLILQLITIIFIPLIKYWFSKLDAADNKNQEDIKGLSNDLQCFKSSVSTEYLKKEDYFNTIAGISKKLDEIIKVVYKLEGKFEGRSKKDE